MMGETNKINLFKISWNPIFVATEALRTVLFFSQKSGIKQRGTGVLFSYDMHGATV